MHRTFGLLTLLLTISACSVRRGPTAAPVASPPFASIGVEHRVSVPWLPPRVRNFGPLIETASRKHGVDANLLAIIVLVESGGDPNAKSAAGAMGLMQLMPPTAAELAARRGLTAHHDWRLLDPGYNIDLGADYLAQQVRRFWTGRSDPTVERASGAYNGGPGRMRRHLDHGEELPGETQRYQRWVVGMWRERHQPRSATFASWFAQGGERRLAQNRVHPISPLVVGPTTGAQPMPCGSSCASLLALTTPTMTAASPLAAPTPSPTSAPIRIATISSTSSSLRVGLQSSSESE